MTNSHVVRSPSAGSVATTVIPDGGSVSGTYIGNVLCEGTATITGDVTVRGSLLAVGELSASIGVLINIYGDFTCQDYLILAAPTDSDSSQVTVFGDMRVMYDFTLECRNGRGGVISVGRDLIIDGTLYADGVDVGANGPEIQIQGNCICQYVNISGGDGDATHNAGGGGTILVRGTCSGIEIIADGGNVMVAGTGDGGNGGSATFYSPASLLGNSSFRGGASAGGNGGIGGSIEADGGITGVSDLYFDGGDCTSDTPASGAGHGGGIFASGTVSFNAMSANGGVRSGNLGGPTDLGLSTGYGGSLSGDGTFSFFNISVNGGSVATDDPSYSGAAGGTLRPVGTIVGRNISATGGDSALNGGTGGVFGNNNDALITSIGGSINISGGNGGVDAGIPGNLYVQGTMTVSEIEMEDGSGTTPAGVSQLFIDGTLTCRTIQMQDSTDRRIQPLPVAGSAVIMELRNTSKTTLRNQNGTESGDISSFLNTGAIFLLDFNGIWRVIDSATIP